MGWMGSPAKAASDIASVPKTSNDVRDALIFMFAFRGNFQVVSRFEESYFGFEFQFLAFDGFLPCYDERKSHEC
uniref:Uncharacterized protein n=1 Tax=Candidatus Kentrum sp. TC TaxID=2126339 RepID=A0A451A3T8_9GAMM|nr:MAG: hypothetical protein BECKTC1821E_GA0114239_11471 [Candidatus Kentron sp. TC]VFK60700.1 MAG: hypothetical protein BECKTC1821F_GA0114240_104815 [Candidatus Kentron sp. TC]